MTLWRGGEPLILASKSAARRQLLAAAGIPIEVHPADIDERALEAAVGMARPAEVASLLAREKALAVARQFPGRLVVGADQVLALGSRRFSKPADRAEAKEQLRALRGLTHELHCALAVARDGWVLYEHVEAARLTVRLFSEDFLQAYLEAAGADVTQSVGGYLLERTGIHLFDRVEGDHFAILGLPLVSLLGFLRREGLLA
jgi:septum formation protein